MASLDELGTGAGFDLIAVHYDTLSVAERERLTATFAARTGGPTLVLLSESRAQEDFARLFGTRLLTNVLVVRDDGVSDSDLLVTVQKIRRGDIFGLEKYFEWGVEARRLTLRSSSEKRGALEAVEAYTRQVGIPARLAACIGTATDEFLSNALFNAPVTEAGERRFAPRPRTDLVELDPGREVALRFCCDGRRFGVSVTDAFGSLRPSDILDYLGRAFRGGDDQVHEGEGGAGLGFYRILDCLSHFVVNLTPGHCTEMIGLVDVSAGYRGFARGGKSFNIFVRGEAAA
jgi:hypothetical protein